MTEGPKTMTLAHPDAVLADLRAGSKKQVLADLAKAAAEIAGVHERVIFDVLVERERLGSTGLGNGIAIPHGRIPGITRVYELFARLNTPVDFESLDNQPVDLIYMLLAPTDAGADHLKALARVSRLLRDGPTCAKLRGSDSEAALTSVLTAPYPVSHAA
jgi:PTS system nitrogen regulatory IIA component